MRDRSRILKPCSSSRRGLSLRQAITCVFEQCFPRLTTSLSRFGTRHSEGRRLNPGFLFHPKPKGLPEARELISKNPKSRSIVSKSNHSKIWIKGCSTPCIHLCVRRSSQFRRRRGKAEGIGKRAHPIGIESAFIYRPTSVSFDTQHIELNPGEINIVFLFQVHECSMIQVA